VEQLVGKLLKNRYRVEAFIGRGGMAEVYKVWDGHRNSYLAIKLLYEDLAIDRVFMRRFRREAHTLSKLQHPNIVRFYGLEQDNRMAFMLLDFIEGQTLKHRIFDVGGPLPLSEIGTIMHAVCGALQFAHREGLVHCDIKPGNIMIDKFGHVLVTDFGIARMTDVATVTMVGLGTPAYMAPEQVSGENPTPQTDIYALGIVLFEMLTGGERPFTGEQAHTTGSTSEKVRWEQMHLQPPSPRRYNAGIPIELEAVVFKCLSKNPSDRYPSALDLLNAVEKSLAPFYGGSPTLKYEDKITPAFAPQDERPIPDQTSPSPAQAVHPTTPSSGSKLPAKRARIWMILIAPILGIALLIGGFLVGSARHPSPTSTNLVAEAMTWGSGSSPPIGSTETLTSPTAVKLLTPAPSIAPSSTPTRTSTPLPTSTFTPSPTVPPTNTPRPPDLAITLGTKCRSGPGLDYNIVGYLDAGDRAVIEGRNSDVTWWWVKNPYSTENCWVSADVGEVQGNVGHLQILTPGPTTIASTSSLHQAERYFLPLKISIKIPTSAMSGSGNILAKNIQEICSKKDLSAQVSQRVFLSLLASTIYE
jgi:serine/threonine protein kinase